jgi:hypothetical protein
MIVLLLAVLSPQAASAQEQKQDQQEPEQKERSWQWGVVPYIWAAGISGTVGAHGRDTHVSIRFIDLVQYVNTAGAVRFEGMSKSNWGFYGEISYVKLDDKTNTSLGQVRADADQTISDLAAMYRFKSPLDVYVGARYQRLVTDINLPGNAEVSQGQYWTSAIVGARYAPTLTKSWQLVVRGDVGAGSSGSTNSVWLAEALGVYRFTKHWSALGGYRYTSTDFKENGFTLSIAQKGIGLAIGYQSK